jgi:proline iminopeptidase
MSARTLLFCILAVPALVFTGAGAASGAEPLQKPAIENGEFTAELNGLKLWYKVSGAGPVCVMPSPAWGPSSDMYFRTLQPLEKHFTIVYLDSRGTGRSQRAKSPKEYTWDHLVTDLEALRAHLKQEKVWLMGHSEGGVVVLHYACKHPERVGGLVLLSTAGAARPADVLAVMARAKKRKGHEPWFDEVMKEGLKPAKTDEEMAAKLMKGMPLYWSDPARFEKHKEHFAATSFSAEADRGAFESKRVPPDFDLTTPLKKLSAPALIVAGDADLLCPLAAPAHLHLSLSNSKLLLIEDCGHFPWLEQADTFNAQVPRFLEALGLRPK